MCILYVYVGVVSTVAGGGGGTASGYVDGKGAMARFNVPTGISSLSTGDLVVADFGNHIIRKITSTGMYSHLQLSHLCIHLHTSSVLVLKPSQRRIFTNKSSLSLQHRILL